MDNRINIRGKEAIPIGVNEIKLGVLNEDTGKVEAQTMYNLKEQNHRNWFLIDLETGKRGVNPGSK